ncbi:hypothetical protein ACGF0D_17920 [Kitasatospora sp. NPDC048298]|uniref:hypothetical protein n=1 Tax=Kitasatospora sp. NPDC048298 TaxID=3364049 RepID=UPI00371F69FD
MSQWRIAARVGPDWLTVDVAGVVYGLRCWGSRVRRIVPLCRSRSFLRRAQSSPARQPVSSTVPVIARIRMRDSDRPGWAECSRWRTDSHVHRIREEISRIDEELAADLTPLPIRQRLRQRRAELEQIAVDHHVTATRPFPAPESQP